jgi:uncharacterized membrane protein (DUF106 family)
VPYEWAFNAVGGGLAGVLLVLLMAVIVGWYFDLKGQIKDLKEVNRALREAINRIADTIEEWTPDQQRRKLKRP